MMQITTPQGESSRGELSPAIPGVNCPQHTTNPGLDTCNVRTMSRLSKVCFQKRQLHFISSLLALLGGGWQLHSQKVLGSIVVTGTPCHQCPHLGWSRQNSFAVQSLHVSWCFLLLGTHQKTSSNPGCCIISSGQSGSLMGGRRTG